MKTNDLMAMPLLLGGYDKIYTNDDGQPHYGPVHTLLKGEDLSQHHHMQSQVGRSGPCEAYVGFGGWINLGYIAELMPKRIVLADINPLQVLYWQLHLNAIAACRTVADFKEEFPSVVDQMAAMVSQNGITLNGHSTNDADRHGAFRNDMQRARYHSCDGYGMSDVSYDRLRHLLAEDRIRLAVLDVKDNAAMTALRDEVMAPGSPRSAKTVTHISNLLDFIKPGALDWAGLLCTEDSTERAIENILYLTHGRKHKSAGGVIWTHAGNRSRVNYTGSRQIMLNRYDTGFSNPLRLSPAKKPVYTKHLTIKIYQHKLK